MDAPLLDSQRAALDFVTTYARTRQARAITERDEVLRMSNVAVEDYTTAVQAIRKHARVALHFHPDRPLADGRMVIESLLESGRYKSQFETQLSNGGLSAFPGGDRDRWEQSLFGGAYHAAGTEAAHRPKYGALDLMLHGDGPSPRFGACYLLLHPRVSQRATFTYLDSHYDPKEKGTFAAFDDIMTALLVESFTRDFAIGEANLTPPRLIDHLCTKLCEPFSDRSTMKPSRNLNHYIEAQVHGDVSLADDAEILVADPAFAGTPIELLLRAFASTFDLALSWHAGFSLRWEDVPSDFRGRTMPSLGQRIAEDGIIDAAAIGRAARDLWRDPEVWRDRGSYAEVLQELKLMWHVLVRYGAPTRAIRPACSSSA